VNVRSNDSDNVAQGWFETEAVKSIQQAAQRRRLEMVTARSVTGDNQKELGRANQYFMLAFVRCLSPCAVLARNLSPSGHDLVDSTALDLRLYSTFIARPKVELITPALGVSAAVRHRQEERGLQIDHTNHLRAPGMERYARSSDEPRYASDNPDDN